MIESEMDLKLLFTVRRWKDESVSLARSLKPSIFSDQNRSFRNEKADPLEIDLSLCFLISMKLDQRLKRSRFSALSLESDQRPVEARTNFRSLVPHSVPLDSLIYRGNEGFECNTKFSTGAPIHWRRTRWT